MQYTRLERERVFRYLLLVAGFLFALESQLAMCHACVWGTFMFPKE